MKIDISNLIPFDKDQKKIFRWDIFAKNKDEKLWDGILEGDSIEIYLDNIDIMSHDGLIWLAFIAKYRSIYNLETIIFLPNDENKIKFLKYVGFDKLRNISNLLIPNDYGFLSSIEYKSNIQEHQLLKEIQYINGKNWATVYHRISNAISNQILNSLNINRIEEEAFEMVNPFVKTVQELIQNIALHGGKENGNGTGFIFFTPPPQKYPYYSFSFTDIGNGFRKTLLEKHKIICESDKDAILEGLLFRYSRPKDQIIGLYPILKFLRKRDGWLKIRSGDILFTLNLANKYNQDIFDKNYKKPKETNQYSAEKKWLESISEFHKCVDIPGSHILIKLKIPTIGLNKL